MAAIRDDGSARCRRSCDVFLACLVLALCLPLLAAVALAIKADSRGPVLRRWVRIRRNGQWIQPLEFRIAARRGSRVRRMQKCLRAARIDTLPQVIDVARGDLTFLGLDRPGFLL
jgi:lipopolysaccharide/colanic/teichoic acid biosynthesis glycosyltransferase